MRIYWLWGLAERMELNEAWPRRFWAAISKWQDRAHGWHHPDSWYR
jgi:hypothetical protein